MGIIKLNKKGENKVTQQNNSAERKENKKLVKAGEENVVDEPAKEIELCELAKQDAGFVEELENLRTANETVYRRNDRTCRKIITAKPTRYLDENGKYRDISNRLTENGNEIENEANSFKVKFNKDATNGRIFDLQKGTKVVSLSAVNSGKTRSHSCGCKCELCSDKEDTVLATLEDGTEIEYVTLTDRIKENIIINEKRDSYEYYFTLNIGDLAVEEGDNNSLLLKDKQTGELQFTIPAPYMYDVNKVRSNDVSYEIDINGEELQIKVVANADFINAEERVFPVVIDPQIVVYSDSDSGTISFHSHIQYFDEDESIRDIEGELTVYEERNGETSEAYIYYVVPTINLAIIQSVRFVLNGNIEGAVKVNGEIFEADDESGNIEISINIQNASGEIRIKPYGVDTYASFCSSGTYGPRFIVDYIEDTNPANNMISFHESPNYKQLDFGEKSKGYFNLNDGTLITSINVVDAKDLTLPINITNVHKLGSGNTTFGDNWKLNLNKKLKTASDDTTNTTRYIYTDEIGDSYLFEEKYYYFEEGKKEPVDKSKITIDINGNLYCGTNPVFKYQHCQGYTLISEVNDFIDFELIEQRQEQQIQLEEYIMQYEPILLSCVRVYAETGAIVSRLQALTKVDYESLVDGMDGVSSYIIMTESEAIQLQSLYANLNYCNKRIALLDTNETDYAQQKAELDEQKTLLSNQKDFLISQMRDNLESIKKDFLNYFSKKAELDLYVLQVPVNYIKDDNGVINGFNKNGDLVFIGDNYGNNVFIKYNLNKQITEIYDHNGAVINFTYIDNKLKSITDNRGRIVKYQYDEDKLIKIIYPDGIEFALKYSSDHLASITSDEGIQWKMSYTKDIGKFKSLIVKRTKPLSGTILDMSVNYETSSTELSYTDGTTETYLFDKAKNVYKYIKKDGAKFETTTNYFYVKKNNAKFITKTREFNYDVNTIKETNEYNELNLLVSRIQDWRDISEEYHVKTKTIYAYDKDNNLISEITTTFKTEKDNEDEEKAENTKRIINYNYNAQGSLVLTESYIEGEELTSGISYKKNVYDENGHVVQTIRWNSLDSSSKFYEQSDYSENGQVISDRDETGEISAKYNYKANSNTINEIKFPNGSKLAYGRNPYNDVITSVTQSTENGESNTTDLVYEYGQPIHVKSGNTVIDYTYDCKGRKNSVSINGNLQAEYSYEDFKNISPDDIQYLKKSCTLKVDGINIKSVYLKEGELDADIYRFDTRESLTVKNDRLYLKYYNTDGVLEYISYKADTEYRINYVYDGYHNMTKAETKSNDIIVLTENYSYNEYGELTEKTITSAVAHTYSYAYKNNAARDLEYVGFGNYKFYPLSDVNGRNTGKEIFNGKNKIAAEYITYRKVGDHATNMPATVWFGGGNAIKDSIKYKYDSCSNISQITENGHLTAKYTYDSLNRLIREDNKALNRTVLYTYDNNGNIVERCEYDYTSKTGEELSTLACKHYSYDYDGDKLISFKHYDEQDNLVTDNFAYNSLGNPTTYLNKSVTWQYGKNITQLGNTTFAYDGLGRRISKGNISFTYDNENNLIKQSNGFEFIYDDKGIVGVKYNGAQYFYRKDAQGNIIAILDSSGKIMVEYKYDAWGNHRVFGLNKVDDVEVLQDIYDEEATDFDVEYLKYKQLGELNPFRYRGYYYDTETVLYYLQTRYYDPEVGRFISQDSIEYADPETINGLNLYAYCGNNPVMNVDPTGCLFGIFLGIILATIAVAATVHDIVQIANGELDVTVTNDGTNVNVANSYKILTPWMQFGYGFYLNHFNPQTKNVIKGSSAGVQYEWMLHNIAYYLGIERDKSQSVDIGASIFSDEHGGFMGNGMKITYIIFGNPISWIWDLIVNGGYGKW